MRQIGECIQAFFSSLRIDADAGDRHHYGEYLHQAIIRFQQTETKDLAYDIYRVFLECYGHSGASDGLSFLSFSEKMRGYEEKAAVLTKKQRDHFIHSVNVFFLGLAIYEANSAYRGIFLSRLYEAEPYSARKSTPREEFFFRWGLASLCHDIGYPIEIITNQVNDFINFASCIGCSKRRINARVEYDRFDLVNSIPESIPKRAFISKYYAAHDTCVYVDLLKPVDLLAHKLHLALGIDLTEVKERLDGYIADSGRSGRVDHGFFSAIILLKWFGYLVQRDGGDPDEFFVPILDVAMAILLHNFFSIALVKNANRPNPFSLEPLTADKSPISFLLILCDELQEWNREFYGNTDKTPISIQSAQLMLSDSKLEMNYILTRDAMPEEFIGAKTGLLNALLYAGDIFPDGVHISCEAIADMPALPASYHLGREQLEKIAIAIHNRYNDTSRRLNPGKDIKYPKYSDLPKDKKYYNFRAAMDYPIMLNAVDCEIRPLSAGGEEAVLTAFSPEEVEMLAKREHDRWMQGRAEQGYRYAPSSNKEKKLNQYMVAYEDLPEDIKEFDRDPARDIPGLLGAIGLGAYRKKTGRADSFSPEEIEAMARLIHHYYCEAKIAGNPGESVKAYDSLTEEMKDSNRRQARGIPNKLSHIACMLKPAGTKGFGEPVTVFSPGDIEMLARIEHDEWMGDKIRHGWTYGPERDDKKRKNPFIIDYEFLDEGTRELDRNTVRKMPEIVSACGYGIFRANQETGNG